LSTRRDEDKLNKNTIQKPEVAINNKQSRDTGNIGHTRYRRTTIKAKEQHCKQKGKSIIKKSGDTSNIGHTRHRRTTIKAKEQHNKQKGKSIIENPEIQATLGTQDTEGRQSKQRNNTANRRESQ
jgi:hypothetical protein